MHENPLSKLFQADAFIEGKKPAAGLTPSTTLLPLEPPSASLPIDAVLDSFAAMLCVVDATRRVQFMNRAARNLIQQQEGLTLREGYLCGVKSDTTQRLDRAIRAACRDQGTQDAFQVGTGGCASMLQISVSALAARPDLDIPGLALVTACRSHGNGHREATLRSLFNLSQSEAAILKGLLDGKTLEQCAQARGVAVSTARSQLKSIFGKTNTTSQAHLMAVAKALPVTTVRDDEHLANAQLS